MPEKKKGRYATASIKTISIREEWKDDFMMFNDMILFDEEIVQFAGVYTHHGIFSAGIMYLIKAYVGVNKEEFLKKRQSDIDARESK